MFYISYFILSLPKQVTLYYYFNLNLKNWSEQARGNIYTEKIDTELYSNVKLGS